MVSHLKREESLMPKLRHIAIAAEDPEAMAEFYKKAFDFVEVGRPNGAPADLAAALFRYNRSVHYVRAITHYAQVLIDDPRAYAGYYSWPVLVRLTTGDVIIPEGNG